MKNLCMCIIKGDNQRAQQLLQTAGYYLLFLLIRMFIMAIHR